MSELGYHVRTSLADQRVIAATVAERRLLARAVLDIGRDYQLLAFRAPDNHLLEAFCQRREAGELARRVTLALRRRLALPTAFSPAHFKPLQDQQHGYNTHRYIMRQDDRHGVDVDPWAEASNLPDLLGLRLIGAYTADNVRRLLPRISAEQLLARFGVTTDQLVSGDIPTTILDHLPEAAAAAAALPHLRGRHRETVAARQAAVHAAGRALSAARLAALLHTTVRTVRRLRAHPPDLALVQAIRRQLRLRAGTLRHPGPPQLEQQGQASPPPPLGEHFVLEATS